MSRISELEFYNDKDVITQIEWLKKNIGGNLIKSLEVKEITDPESTDFGKTDIVIHMENGDTHEASYVSALVKSVETRQEGDDVILTFNLATGDKFETRFTVSVHATASWDSLEGTPQESVPLTEWMNTKADKTELTAEETARTDSDTGLLQAITAEETARKSADDGIYGRITGLNKDLDDETTARTEADALKEDKANKVSSWSATPSDDKYPSEKLVFESTKLTSRKTETTEFVFAEHTMKNGVAYLEGAVFSTTVQPTSSKKVALTTNKSYKTLKVICGHIESEGYHQVTAETEFTAPSTVVIGLYNEGSIARTVSFEIIGIGVLDE